MESTVFGFIKKELNKYMHIDESIMKCINDLCKVFNTNIILSNIDCSMRIFIKVLQNQKNMQLNNFFWIIKKLSINSYNLNIVRLIILSQKLNL